jgi:thioredoxin-like negative regulator of GroEL
VTGPTPREQLVAELRESDELPNVLAALESGDDERALELLTEAVVAAEGEARQRLLRLTVCLFSELGDEDPLTMRYRRRLAASLY